VLLAAKVVALMSGRAHVSLEDVQRVLVPSLRHRLIPNFEADADGVTTDQILAKLMEEVPTVSDAVAGIAG
jgi:MoxR-like ATPase